MPIKRLEPRKPSEHQLTKAQRCIVTTHELGHWVWDPLVNSQHIITLGICDCLGFESTGFCSHIVAVQLYRQKDRSATQAIAELFDL